jgi:hypothetical protein
MISWQSTPMLHPSYLNYVLNHFQRIAHPYNSAAYLTVTNLSALCSITDKFLRIAENQSILSQLTAAVELHQSGTPPMFAICFH